MTRENGPLYDQFQQFRDSSRYPRLTQEGINKMRGKPEVVKFLSALVNSGAIINQTPLEISHNSNKKLRLEYFMFTEDSLGVLIAGIRGMPLKRTDLKGIDNKGEQLVAKKIVRHYDYEVWHEPCLLIDSRLRATRPDFFVYNASANIPERGMFIEVTNNKYYDDEICISKTKAKQRSILASTGTNFSMWFGQDLEEVTRQPIKLFPPAGTIFQYAGTASVTTPEDAVYS